MGILNASATLKPYRTSVSIGGKRMAVDGQNWAFRWFKSSMMHGVSTSIVDGCVRPAFSMTPAFCEAIDKQVSDFVHWLRNRGATDITFVRDGKPLWPKNRYAHVHRKKAAEGSMRRTEERTNAAKHARLSRSNKMAQLQTECDMPMHEVDSTAKPATTEPPEAERPATEPSTTEPPAAERPATEPSTTEPPAAERPATEPSTTEPPPQAPVPMTCVRVAENGIVSVGAPSSYVLLKPGHDIAHKDDRSVHVGAHSGDVLTAAFVRDCRSFMRSCLQTGRWRQVAAYTTCRSALGLRELNCPEEELAAHMLAQDDEEREVVRTWCQIGRPPKESMAYIWERLECVGVRVLDAGDDAERYCARMTITGEADVVVSADYDTLAFGAKEVLMEAGTRSAFMLTQENVLGGMHISLPQFIGWAIMCGTDYCNKPFRVGPATALKYIRQKMSLRHCRDVLARHFKTQQDAEEFWLMSDISAGIFEHSQQCLTFCKRDDIDPHADSSTIRDKWQSAKSASVPLQLACTAPTLPVPTVSTPTSVASAPSPRKRPRQDEAGGDADTCAGVDTGGGEPAAGTGARKTAGAAALRPSVKRARVAALTLKPTVAPGSCKLQATPTQTNLSAWLRPSEPS